MGSLDFIIKKIRNTPYFLKIGEKLFFPSKNKEKLISGVFDLLKN